MKIVTTSGVFPKETDTFEIITKLANLGFDGIDIAFDYCAAVKDSPFNGDNYLEWAKMLREKADSLGVSFLASHASFDASCHSETVEKTMKCAQILGTKFTVVHPIFLRQDRSIYEDKDEFIEVNLKGIKPILKVAEEYGITVLTENLLWGASIYPKIISELIDAVDCPNFGWCYDTGHANSMKVKCTDLLEIKNKPLSLHIQDNHELGNCMGADEHLMPGDGTIDWELFMRVLKQIGYSGEFVLEAHHQPLDASDDNERLEILTEMLNRSRKLNEYYESL